MKIQNPDYAIETNGDGDRVFVVIGHEPEGLQVGRIAAMGELLPFIKNENCKFIKCRLKSKSGDFKLKSGVSVETIERFFAQYEKE